MNRAAAMQRAISLANSNERYLLGIVGPPGSGKSTFAADLVEHVNAGLAQASPAAAVLAMDGFHLPAAEIKRLNLADRKGAPHTFNADAFADTLGILRSGQIAHVPIYDRELHDVVPAAATIAASTRLIVVEGNYLLLDEDPWRRVRQLLDEAWYLDVPLTTCMHRVRQRHLAGGRTPTQADRKITTNDRPNAHLVTTTRPRADHIITP